MIKLPKWWRGLRFIPARVGYYLRYDLKEIITPSSIPNPPDYVEPPKRGVGNLWKVGSLPHCAHARWQITLA